MTISAESIAKRVSERFMLVRLTPARYVGSDLASEGSGVYGMTFSYPVARVERNGVTLTETASSPPGTNDHWYHDETTGTFKVKLAGAPDPDTNVIVVYYYLFYTAHRQRTAWETPTDNTTTSRAWEPRLRKYPVIKQSIKNAISGVFSVQLSGLDIINTDYAFQEYLTDDDSFSQKAVDIWMGIDTTSNIKLVFSGRISKLSYDKTQVSISVLDAFDALTQPAFMGDTADEAHFFAHVGSFPDMYYGDHGKPVPFIVGSSRVAYSNDTILKIGGTVAEPIYNLDYRQCHKGVCIDYSGVSPKTGTINREWGLCRVDGALKTLSFGTYTNANYDRHGGGNYYVFGGTRWGLTITTNAHNLEPGDSFRWTHASVNSGGNCYAVVVKTTPTVIYAVCVSDAEVSTQITGTGFTFTANSAPAVAIYKQDTNKLFPLAYELDFTVQTVATEGGNSFIKIVLEDDFEIGVVTGGTAEKIHPSSGGVAMTYVDPARDTLVYRATQASSSTTAAHATVMQTLLESAGLTVDAASVTAANAALVAQCAFSIPFFDETGYGPYRKYAEAIATSALGYVKLGSDGEVEYDVLEGTAAGDGQTTHTILRDTIRADVEYADVTTEMIADNPHYATGIGTASVNEESAKARYLHGVDNKVRFRHVFTDISGRLPDILALRSNRRVTYKFGNAVATVNAELGEAATLTHPAVAGGDGTVNVKLITLDLNTNDISVEATDLLGL